MIRSLNIMEWNANGLLQRQLELEAVLNIDNVDICLISESHFTKQSYIKFKGYRTYHALHPNNVARGGSSIIIKESIQHNEHVKLETERIQLIGVCVEAVNYRFVVAAVYCPPRYSFRKEDHLSMFDMLGTRFILGGDFNSKHIHWGSRLTTHKGKVLYEAVRESRCESLSTGKPTYWPTDTSKIPDLIDFFIIKNISVNYLQVEESFDLNSDHSPIILKLSDTILQKQNNYPTLVNKYTDWDGFQQVLEERINLNSPLTTADQIDEELEKFVTDIQQAAWCNTPQTRKRRTVGNNYPLEIREMIAEKRRARRRWQHSRSPQDKRLLNTLTQELKREIQFIKNESINSYLSNLTGQGNTDYSLWKASKKIKTPIQQVPPIRKLNRQWAKNNEEKAQAFADHLVNVFQPNVAAQEDLEIEGNIMQENQELMNVSVEEVRKEIKLMNAKKTPGFDLITGLVLKHLPRKALIKLTNILNASFRLRFVPGVWKVAEVIMLLKPGKEPHEVASYRPISLLPVLSKLFERILLSRLKPIIERKQLIPNHQFGFRKKHSTIDQVHRIVNIIEKSLEEKKVCSAVFLDIGQAFDKVWHEGLLYKLKKMLPKQFTEILQSYLTGRYFRVKYEDSYSDLREIKAGVPQGSVLGPVLYLLFTSDIPNLEENTTATFADDTALLAVDSDVGIATAKLQRSVNKIQDWTKKWRMKLNEEKSIHVNFTNKRAVYLPININGINIPHENQAKYLGMTLDAKLRWKEHVKKKKEELNIKYKKFYWLIGRNSSLSIPNKLLLYKQIFKPVWTYGIQLWGCTKQSNVTIIQRFQNKVLRNIVDAPWYVRNSDIHRDLGVNMVSCEIQRYAESHEERLHQHTNVEAIQLLDNGGLVRRLKRRKPFELVCSESGV